MNDSTRKPATQTNEEPEVVQEEAIPSDGRDREGEELMKQVRNDRLQEPPPEPDDKKKNESAPDEKPE
jgi:hypothetical protein